MNLVFAFLVIATVAKADFKLSLKDSLSKKNQASTKENDLFWRRIVEGSFSISKPTRSPARRPTNRPTNRTPTNSPTRRPTRNPSQCKREWVRVDSGFFGEQSGTSFRNRNLITDRDVSNEINETLDTDTKRKLITAFDLPKVTGDITINQDTTVEDTGITFDPAPALDISTIEQSFMGTEYTDLEPRSFPSDPMAAASRSMVIEVTTGEGGLVEAFTRNGNLMWSVTLPVFFQTGVRMFDPKVVYDFQEDRFVLISLHRDYASEVSIIGVAVSTNDNPGRNDWILTTVNSVFEGTWADYPGLEVDEEAIYITANRFTFNQANPSFLGSILFIVAKQGFYNGNNNVSSQGYNFNQVAGVTYMPAEIRSRDGAGGNIGTYLVGYQGLGPVSIVRIRNPLNNPTFEEQQVDIPRVDELPNRLQLAPQLGSDVGIEINQREVFDAAWHDNSLWAVTQFLINGRTTAYWFEFDTSNEQISLIQSGPITGNDIAPQTTTFYPSVTVNNNGVAAFGFSASASTIYAGAFVTYRNPSDALGTVRSSIVLKEGEGPYVRTAGRTRNRWGDYSGVAVDPRNENCFWFTNVYAQQPCEPVNGEAGCWGTYIGRLCVNQDQKVTDKPDKPTPAPSNTENTCSSLGIDVDSNKDGTIVVAGEPGYDGAAGADTGRVRIYQRSPGSTDWTETVIDGTRAGQLFGTSVAVSDFQQGWIAMSSFGNDGNGKVDMYRFNGNKWVKDEKFNNLGVSVDLSGGDGQETLRVAIGDRRKGKKDGMTEVYEYSPNNQSWELISKFTGNPKEELGFSVALSDDGKFLAAGAPANNNGRGIVYVYELDSGNLVRITGEGQEQLGASIAFNDNGKVIAIGAPTSGNNNIGRVKIYQRKDGNFGRKGNDIEGNFNKARIGSGNTVSLDDVGNRLAVGSDPANNDKAGVVRIFDYNKGSDKWVEIEIFEGTGNGDVETVALSGEGTTIAIGAPGARNCRGQVRVFDEACKE